MSSLFSRWLSGFLVPGFVEPERIAAEVGQGVIDLCASEQACPVGDCLIFPCRSKEVFLETCIFPKICQKVVSGLYLVTNVAVW